MPSPAAPAVTRLSTTPIKGFALSHPDTIELDSNGAVGDRDFFVVDDKSRLLSITRTGEFASWRAVFDRRSDLLEIMSEDGQRLAAPATGSRPLAVDFSGTRPIPGHLVEGPWNDWLSEIAGQPVFLVRTETPGAAFDEYPMTMLSDESVAELGRHAPDGSIDARRFRMLIGFSGVSAYAEETWHGQTVRIGSAALRMGGPVPRCNATTRNPDSGDSDLKTLHLIHQHRGRQTNEFGDGLNLGVYAEVVTPGTISVGDNISVGV
jgi:uncharacterized protein YcbX